MSIGMIGIIVALALLIYIIYKGVDPVVGPPIAAIIVILFNNVGFVEGYSKIFMGGLGGFLTNNFPIYLWGAILGEIYNVSGGAKSIAHSVAKAFRGNKDHIEPITSILIIFVAGTVMAYGGISSIVLMFVLMPLTLEVMRESKIPHYMAPGILLGSIATAALAMPGSPQLHNSIPPTYLGTSPTAALIPGLIGGVVVIGLNIFYLNYEARKEISAGNVYNLEMVASSSDAADYNADYENLPNAFVSLIPLLTTFAFYNFMKLYVGYSILLGILVAIVCFWNQLGLIKTIVDIFGRGAKTSTHLCVASASLAGFGAVVSATEAFKQFSVTITSIPGPPLITAAIAVALVTGICGSGPAGVGASLPMFKDTFAAMGMNMSALHRVAAFSGTTLDTLPTNAGYIAATGLAKAKTNESYKYVGVCTVINTSIATLVVAVLCTIFPNLA